MINTNYNDKPPEITTEYSRLDFAVMPGLQQVQIYALDYYKRGLNVFPIPTPWEIQQVNNKRPGSYAPGEKPSYIHAPLYYKRLHVCGWECEEQRKKGKLCPGSVGGASFLDLFDFANIGVILGRTSGNLACIDCDDQPAAETVYRELMTRGLEFWAYSTSRGVNFLFRCLEGELSNLPSCNITGAQLWAHNRFVVLPPSKHASGVVYSWLDRTDPRYHLTPGEQPPVISVNQLDWLGAKLNKAPKAAPELYGLPDWTSCLSDRNRRILASVHNDGARNTNLTNPAYDLAAAINNGTVTYKDAELLLLDTGARCSPPYPHKTIKSMLKSALKKRGLTSSKNYNNPNAPAANVAIKRAFSFAASFDWRTMGRTAQTDRAVFLAFCERAKVEGPDSFRASIRELAELANIQSINTIRKAIKRLTENQIIEQKQISDRINATRYTFGARVPNNDTLTNTCINSVSILDTPKDASLPRTPAEQDVFIKIGRIGWRVWQHLKDNPESTISAISKACDIPRSSAARSMQKLITASLVTFSQSENMFYGELLEAEELENLADQLGTSGKSDQRKRKNQRDREILANQQLARARNIWRIWRGENDK
jgi:predicted transcriptional regulator